MAIYDSPYPVPQQQIRANLIDRIMCDCLSRLRVETLGKSTTNQIKQNPTRTRGRDLPREMGCIGVSSAMVEEWRSLMGGPSISDLTLQCSRSHSLPGAPSLPQFYLFSPGNSLSPSVLFVLSHLCALKGHGRHAWLPTIASLPRPARSQLEDQVGLCPPVASASLLLRSPLLLHPQHLCLCCT